ncbi:MAG: His-Xaa-Ser system protein HxsD [Candidatus Parcubacteria bacterium]|nr:His-Xaa-Ser system protein HxsD [Candidatus Parcubacteria bacterium]
MNRIRIEVSKNEVVLEVSTKTYSLGAIYGASYVFLDKIYVFLDKGAGDNVIITLKPKASSNKKELENLSGEFSNQLLNYSLRESIAKNNQKIREYIVGRALVGALGEDSSLDDATVTEEVDEKVGDWKGDDLGIAVPWEEKFAKPKRVKKK